MQQLTRRFSATALSCYQLEVVEGLKFFPLPLPLPPCGDFLSDVLSVKEFIGARLHPLIHPPSYRTK